MHDLPSRPDKSLAYTGTVWAIQSGSGWCDESVGGGGLVGSSTAGLWVVVWYVDGWVGGWVDGCRR